MRHHPLYFAACVLFAVAIEFIILRRIRKHGASEEDAEDERSSPVK